MKKACKIIWKVTKVYVVLDLLALMFLGILNVLGEYSENPDVSVIESNANVFRKAFERFEK